MSKKVFCSHRSLDKPQVARVVRRLKQLGYEAWLDAYEIRDGDDVVAKINEGLAACDVGLVFCGPADLGYQQALAAWRALPFWKRWRTRKPRPPGGA